jgi:hypothetical protein
MAFQSIDRPPFRKKTKREPPRALAGIALTSMGIWLYFFDLCILYHKLFGDWSQFIVKIAKNKAAKVY